MIAIDKFVSFCHHEGSGRTLPVTRRHVSLDSQLSRTNVGQTRAWSQHRALVRKTSHAFNDSCLGSQVLVDGGRNGFVCIHLFAIAEALEGASAARFHKCTVNLALLPLFTNQIDAEERAATSAVTCSKSRRPLTWRAISEAGSSSLERLQAAEAPVEPRTVRSDLVSLPRGPTSRST